MPSAETTGELQKQSTASDGHSDMANSLPEHTHFNDELQPHLQPDEPADDAMGAQHDDKEGAVLSDASNADEDVDNDDVTDGRQAVDPAEEDDDDNEAAASDSQPDDVSDDNEEDSAALQKIESSNDEMEGVTVPERSDSAEANDGNTASDAKDLDLPTEDDASQNPGDSMGQVEITVLVGHQEKISDAEKSEDNALKADSMFTEQDTMDPSSKDPNGQKPAIEQTTGATGMDTPTASHEVETAERADQVVTNSASRPTDTGAAIQTEHSATVAKDDDSISKSQTLMKSETPAAPLGTDAKTGKSHQGTSLSDGKLSTEDSTEPKHGNADIENKQSALQNLQAQAASIEGNVPTSKQPNQTPESDANAKDSSSGADKDTSSGDTTKLPQEEKNKQNAETPQQKSSPTPTKNLFQPRSLRPRNSPTTKRTADSDQKTGARSETKESAQQSNSSAKVGSKTISRSSKSAKQSNKAGEVTGSRGSNVHGSGNADVSHQKRDSMRPDTPDGPVQDADGLYMKINEAVFVTHDQLTEQKKARLGEKNLLPIEKLTFADLRKYNRDQLRAYCFIYSLVRGKKTEMEADLSRYVSMWNKSSPGFRLSEYVPTSQRTGAAGGGEPSESNGSEATRPGGSSGSGANQGAAVTTPSRTMSRKRVSPSADSAAGSTDQNSTSNQQTPLKIQKPNVAGKAPTHANPVTQQQGGVQTPSPGVPVANGGVNAARPAANAPAAKAVRPTPPVLPQPRGYGTSFKQKTHAQQASAKYKAAYNGAGPAIVNIVENAAAYFEGKDSPEVVLDKAKSYERYQFNVDLLTEIFDGPLPSELGTDAQMTEAENGQEPGQAQPGMGEYSSLRKQVMQDIAERMIDKSELDNAKELSSLEARYQELENETKHIERTNMRLFQRLERAESKEEVEAVKADFEKQYNIRIEGAPPPIVRRKLDKSIPMTVMSDEDCHILRFKVS